MALKHKTPVKHIVYKRSNQDNKELFQFKEEFKVTESKSDLEDNRELFPLMYAEVSYKEKQEQPLPVYNDQEKDSFVEEVKEEKPKSPFIKFYAAIKEKFFSGSSD